MKETLSSQVDVVAEIHADDLRWSGEPIPLVEHRAVADEWVDVDDLCLYVAELQEELTSVRLLTHRAIAEVAERNRELAAASQRQVDLIEENRRYVRGVMLASVKERPKPRVT